MEITNLKIYFMKKILFTLFLFCSLSVFSNNNSSIEKNNALTEISFKISNFNDATSGSITCYMNIYYNGELVHTVHAIGFGENAVSAIANCKSVATFLAYRFIENSELN